MRAFLTDLLTQLRGIWARLDAGQRLVVSAVLLATVTGLGAIVWYAGRPSYETIFTANSNDEIARVKQALQQAGISYNVDDSGRAFQVERAKIGLANMAISEAGLIGVQMPSIGGGTSLIEDAETKAWKLDAASRAQAAAAIQSLEGVLQVTVTASRPRRAVAYRDRAAEAKASAAVVLRLKSGASFETIARKAASIASAQLMVPMENIDVVSAAGGGRWRFDPSRETGGGSSEFLALQRSISDERTRLAQERLDQLWPGKTAVQVTVELDPSWEIRSEKVVPTEAVIRSEEISKNTSDSGAGKSVDASPNTTRNETRTREFVTEIGERRVGKMMPELRRMTVAVLYDRALTQATGFDEQQLVAAVKAIVGWDPDRDRPEAFSTLVGDFATSDYETVAPAGPGFGDLALRWGPTIGQVVGVFVVVLFLRSLFRRPARPAGASAAAALAIGGDERLPPEEQQKRMRREIERSIAGDPAALARLLETWLMEQKT